MSIVQLLQRAGPEGAQERSSDLVEGQDPGLNERAFDAIQLTALVAYLEPVDAHLGSHRWRRQGDMPDPSLLAHVQRPSGFEVVCKLPYPAPSTLLPETRWPAECCGISQPAAVPPLPSYLG
jgi:hypothetical protein